MSSWYGQDNEETKHTLDKQEKERLGQHRKQGRLRIFYRVAITLAVFSGLFVGLRWYIYSDWWLEISCPSLTAAIPFSIRQDNNFVGEGNYTDCQGSDCVQGLAEINGEFRILSLGFNLNEIVFRGNFITNIFGHLIPLKVGITTEDYKRQYELLKFADLVAFPGAHLDFPVNCPDNSYSGTCYPGTCSITLHKGQLR
jgi:hypothetical protein